MTPQQQATRHTPHAFTLVELLVVLSLIVLALAAAVPAFHYITGSRSTDAAENMVSSMLQRARSLAIQNAATSPNTYVGVLFFINPTDNRSTMALISSDSTLDASARYNGWTDTSFQQAAGGGGVTQQNTAYATGDKVSALNLVDVKGSANVQLSNADRYRNVAGAFTHDASNNQGPPLAASNGWGSVAATFDIIPDATFETLPANVGLQTINDPQGTARDRYLTTGVILFDSAGRCVSVPFKFKQGSQVFNLLSSNPSTPAATYIPASTGAFDTLSSQLGLVLYDRTAFLNQSSSAGAFTDGDAVYKFGGLNGQDLIRNLTGPTQANQEGNEETWLDQNTTPLFVNRGNGTLLRGQ